MNWECKHIEEDSKDLMKDTVEDAILSVSSGAICYRLLGQFALPCRVILSGTVAAYMGLSIPHSGSLNCAQ